MTQQDPQTPPTSDRPPVASYASGSTAGASLPDAIRAGWNARSGFDRQWMLFGGIALLVVAISTLLPWISFFLGSVAGIRSGAGKLMLLISIAALAWLAFSLSKAHLLTTAWLVLAAIGAGLTFWSIVLIIQFSRAFSSRIGDGEFEAKLSAGGVAFGLYLTLIASLATAASFSVLSAPSLAKFQFGAVAKSLWIWLGVGAVIGLVMGLITGT